MIFTVENIFNRDNEGVLHMSQLETSSEAEVDKIFERLKNTLQRIPGKILFVDNPLRHMCCSKHRSSHRNLLKYQAFFKQKN